MLDKKYTINNYINTRTQIDLEIDKFTKDIIAATYATTIFRHVKPHKEILPAKI